MLAARVPLILIGLVCAVLGAYLAVSSRGEAALARANAALLAGNHSEALSELEGVDGELAGRASAVRGYAYFRRGQLRPARAALQKAARRDPNNWVVQRDYAIVLLRLGERPKARARMRRALALNPRMLLPPGFVVSK